MTALLRNNASLRTLARKSTNHLFDDIGLNRDAFINETEDQLRKRYWWYR
jgi:uncharacterized protein YjiS (DUF1127 family)